ncbi:MAG TPA: hypothetical protein VK941_13220 [Gillisia sp.]|nr:hypothetical protein [Gillisia sp.]
MKIFSAHISSLLGLIMIVAILLPSLHALGHDLDSNDISQETKVIAVNIDCELCDFHFSSLDLPEYTNYNIFLPVKETVHSISLKDTVYPYPLSLFSLRAPPAVNA